MKLVSNSDVQHVGTINKSIDFASTKENIVYYLEVSIHYILTR